MPVKIAASISLSFSYCKKSKSQSCEILAYLISSEKREKRVSLESALAINICFWMSSSSMKWKIELFDVFCRAHPSRVISINACTGCPRGSVEYLFGRL